MLGERDQKGGKGMRIAILGYSGAGKSTLAARLGERLSLPVLHLDSVHFAPGWVERPDAEAAAEVRGWMARPDWIIEGNYTALLRAERLALADRILLLELPRFACLGAALRRYRRYRGHTRPDMAPGCPEKFDAEFFWWLLYAGRTAARRADFDAIARRYPGKVIRLRSRRAVNRLLAEVAGRLT